MLLPELAGHLSEADAVDRLHARRPPRAPPAGAAAPRGPGPADLELAEAFERKLAEHLAFEERTLFPALQETLGCDALAALSTEIAPARKEPTWTGLLAILARGQADQLRPVRLGEPERGEGRPVTQ